MVSKSIIIVMIVYFPVYPRIAVDPLYAFVKWASGLHSESDFCVTGVEFLYKPATYSKTLI